MTFAVWRACERIGILPPEIKPTWDANDVDTKSLIIAYNQIRGDEDAQDQANRVVSNVR